MLKPGGTCELRGIECARTGQATFRWTSMAEDSGAAEGRPRKRRTAVTSVEREHRIGSDPAQKMVVKMRDLITEKGISAATLRALAQSVRQSETAPTWYFGSKGRLLIEVLRHDHNMRMAVLCSKLKPAATRGELLEALHATLRAFLDERALRGSQELLAEITRLALDDEDVAARRSELRREYRDVLARLLEDKEREGVVSLRAHATSVAALLISLAQGLAVEITADRGWKPQEAIADAELVIDALLGEPAAVA